ncbi:hypothetical protein HID58_042687, partial [Brassica napus]
RVAPSTAPNHAQSGILIVLDLSFSAKRVLSELQEHSLVIEFSRLSGSIHPKVQASCVLIDISMIRIDIRELRKSEAHAEIKALRLSERQIDTGGKLKSRPKNMLCRFGPLEYYFRGVALFLLQLKSMTEKSIPEFFKFSSVEEESLMVSWKFCISIESVKRGCICLKTSKHTVI